MSEELKNEQTEPKTKEESSGVETTDTGMINLQGLGVTLEALKEAAKRNSQ